ncbi:MAG: TIGR02269 family lipoprotein [Hyalangium sp.]|uniref:SitA6 family polymorphic toxin lipoprotein n=1 Tax=Hyalangium sp. TaxID=2028555 RepID=UPI003899BD8C
MWLLALGALAACATIPAPENESVDNEEVGHAVSFQEACQDESSLLALCHGQQCGLYRCREVLQRLMLGQTALAWAEVEPLAEVGGTAQRNWGSAQEVPWDSRPVLVIPWDHQPPLLPSQLKELEEAAQERNKQHEQHHVFPRAFREFFERKGINIDEYTILLEVMKHRSIHAGPKGGPWNARWGEWIPKHLGAPKEEIFRYAGQLIYEFELFGPVLPYRKRLPQPLPPGYQGP